MPGSIPADLATEVADLIGSVNRRIRRAVGCRLGELGMTHGRMRALWRLGTAQEPIRMGELAEALGVVPRSATTLVDDLAEAGLVARVPDPEDRRATRVAVTTAGRRMLDTLEEVRSEVAHAVLSELSREELETISALLGRLDE